MGFLRWIQFSIDPSVIKGGKRSLVHVTNGGGTARVIPSIKRMISQAGQHGSSKEEEHEKLNESTFSHQIAHNTLVASVKEFADYVFFKSAGLLKASESSDEVDDN